MVSMNHSWVLGLSLIRMIQNAQLKTQSFFSSPLCCVFAPSNQWFPPRFSLSTTGIASLRECAAL